VTLLVRDLQSEAFALEHFEARVLRSPDMAFALGPIPRLAPPTQALVIQAREDKERESAPVPGVATHDWLGELRDGDRTALARHQLRLALATGRRERGGPAVALIPGRHLSAYDAFARWNVDRGLRMLSRGETVITDRLHGHILCCLMGIRHVLVGDRHGKIRNYWNAWSHRAGLARWADDFEQAVELVRGEPQPEPAPG
jgi:pyruvyl transferase EpsO